MIMKYDMSNGNEDVFADCVLQLCGEMRMLVGACLVFTMGWRISEICVEKDLL